MNVCLLKGLTVCFKYMTGFKLRNNSPDICHEVQINPPLARRMYLADEIESRSYVKQRAVSGVVSLKSTELCSCKTGSRVCGYLARQIWHVCLRTYAINEISELITRTCCPELTCRSY